MLKFGPHDLERLNINDGEALSRAFAELRTMVTAAEATPPPPPPPVVAVAAAAADGGGSTKSDATSELRASTASQDAAANQVRRLRMGWWAHR